MIAILVVLQLYCFTGCRPQPGSPGIPVTLHDNVTGSKACIGEKVMYTCIVGGDSALLWYSSATFREITMACRSSPTKAEGGFLANVTECSEEIGQQSIISTLSVTASVQINNTEITCMNLGRTYNSTTTLQVIGTDSVYLHNISVTPVTLQTALLRWNITPSNVVHCIPNYTIKCIGGNGTEWKTETPNSRLLYMVSGLKSALEYNCSVTAAGGSSARVTFTIEPQAPNHPSGLYGEAVFSYVEERFYLDIHWQVPSNANWLSPAVKDYELQYSENGNTTTLDISSPATSYSIRNVSAGSVYDIRLAAMNKAGKSKYNPSLHLIVPVRSCAQQPVTTVPQILHSVIHVTTTMQGGQASLSTITAISVAAVTCSAITLCAGILLTIAVCRRGVDRCLKPSTHLEKPEQQQPPVYEEVSDNKVIEIQQNAAYAVVQS